MSALVRDKDNWHLYFNTSWLNLCMSCNVYPGQIIDSFPYYRKLSDSAFSQWGRAFYGGSSKFHHAILRTGDHTLEHRIYRNNSSGEWIKGGRTIEINLPAGRRILSLGPIVLVRSGQYDSLRMELYGDGGRLATLWINGDSTRVTYPQGGTKRIIHLLCG